MSDEVVASEDELHAFIDALIDDDSLPDPSQPNQVKVRRSDALRVVRDFQETADQACAAMPAVADGLGLKLACLDGCNYCCEQLVLISAPEADVIAEWLSAPGRESLIEQFHVRAKAWLQTCGDDAKEALTAQGQANFPAAAARVARHQMLCPLHDGDGCTVYGVRPFICRQVWVAGTNEHCRVDGDPHDVQLISSEEHEKFFRAAGRACRGLQYASGEGLLFQPLPTAISAALARLADAGAEGD